MKSGICAAIISLIAASSAQAQSVSAHVPGSVAAVLETSGLPAERGTDPQGNPAIVSNVDGITFTVFFYGCVETAACQDLQLRALFETEAEVTAQMLNDWNGRAYVGKAYQMEDGRIALEHPIVGVDGLSRYNMQRVLVSWNVALNEFRSVVSPSASEATPKQ